MSAPVTAPRNGGELQVALDRARALIEGATTFEQAIMAEGLAEGLRRAAIGMDIPKAIVADAAMLMIWAQRRVGEMLGEAKPGPQSFPRGKDLGDTARHRYRRIADIAREEMDAYVVDARDKYLADEARIGVFSLRAILRFFGHEGGAAKPAEIVKPSDNWNFAKPSFVRLGSNQDDPHGYIPGDLYACALHYWTKPGDVVVAPMAGSGMILHVYENRERWMRPEPWDLDIHAADLVPRGPYQDRIERRDALAGLPRPADLVIADIPYFGLCGNLYSKDERDLGNMTLERYGEGLSRMAAAWAPSLKPGGRIVVIAAASYTDTKAARRRMIMPMVIEAFWESHLELVDIAFASRRIQQAQNPDMARMNNWARVQRAMLTDMAVVMCFGATIAG